MWVGTMKRIIRAIILTAINLTAFLDNQLYMKLKISALRKCGMGISGQPVYISRSVRFDGTDYSLISIGEGAVISSGVLILTHDFSITRAVIAGGHTVRKEFPIIRPVKIGANCFVGARSILLPGTELGEGVIVGAGAVVRGNVPQFSIVIGNPAIVVGDTRAWASRQMDENPDFKRFLAPG